MTADPHSIARSVRPGPAAWRREVAAAVTAPEDLPLRPGVARRIRRAARRYPMRIPPLWLARMDPGDPGCPLRRQVLADPRELYAGGAPDPLREEHHWLGPGIIRRFPDRLLALVSADCPVHCRHCNRKRYWNRPGPVARPADIARALERTPAVREVILSGGEPLLLADQHLDRLLAAARSSSAVELVRIHTRMPGVVPSRITSGLIRVLRRHAPLWMSVQFNHARELGSRARRALERLREAGVPVVNQAVLLRGVNDTVTAQAKLGRALLASGVKPHYLFQLDRATGTVHFQVSTGRAIALVRELRARHSGLLVPHLLVDLPGHHGKVPVCPTAGVEYTSGGTLIPTPDGSRILYQA